MDLTARNALIFTWDEVNIITENIRGQNKAGFLGRLQRLAEHTVDRELQHSLTGLIEKVELLTETEVAQLRDAAGHLALGFPANYRIQREPLS